MIDYLDSVSLQDLVEQQRMREQQPATRQISITREHKAALELPTSSLQSIDSNGTRRLTGKAAPNLQRRERQPEPETAPDRSAASTGCLSPALLHRAGRTVLAIRQDAPAP